MNKARLIQDTGRYFGVVTKSLETYWRAFTIKKPFQLYVMREDISTTPDGLPCVNDGTVIPLVVLIDLNLSHFGVEKMKLLLRLNAW